MTSTKQAAVRLCVAVAQNHDIPSPTARIAAWLIGVAELRGGFPIEVSCRQIQLGVDQDGVKVQGTGCHNATIRESLEWLETRGLISISEGAYSGGGHNSLMIEAK